MFLSGSRVKTSKYLLIYLGNRGDDDFANNQATKQSQVEQNHSSKFIVELALVPDEHDDNDQIEGEAFPDRLDLIFTREDSLYEQIHAGEKYKTSEVKCDETSELQLQSPGEDLSSLEVECPRKNLAYFYLPHILSEDSCEKMNDHGDQLCFSDSKLADAGHENTSFIFGPVR